MPLSHSADRQRKRLSQEDPEQRADHNRRRRQQSTSAAPQEEIVAPEARSSLSPPIVRFFLFQLSVWCQRK